MMELDAESMKTRLKTSFSQLGWWLDIKNTLLGVFDLFNETQLFKRLLVDLYYPICFFLS